MTIPSPPNWPWLVRVHLLVSLGRQQHRVRIERVEHAVARRVLHVAQIDVGPAQAVLEEREDVAQVRAHVPGP
jgi:hypothetical protein